MSSSSKGQYAAIPSASSGIVGGSKVVESSSNINTNTTKGISSNLARIDSDPSADPSSYGSVSNDDNNNNNNLKPPSSYISIGGSSGKGGGGFPPNIVPFQIMGGNKNKDDKDKSMTNEDGERKPLLGAGRRRKEEDQPWRTKRGKLLITVFVIALLICALLYHYLFDAGAGCLGAPYLYVTHHGGKNIMKISRDGCLLKEKVLWGNFKSSDLRGMTLGSYNGKDSLFVLDSHSHSSQLLVYSDCSYFSGMRSFIRAALDFKYYPGLSHPYSVSLTKRQRQGADRSSSSSATSVRSSQQHTSSKIDKSSSTLFVSSQHTDLVQYFTPDEFKPKRMPPDFYRSYIAVNNINMSAVDPYHLKYYNGTFIQFGLPGQHKDFEQGVRGVLAVEDEVWVANEDLHKVFVFNSMTGSLVGSISVPYPIGLYVSEDDTNSIFIGFRSSDTKHSSNSSNISSESGSNNKGQASSSSRMKTETETGGVVLVDRSKKEKVMRYSLLNMKHPTGMAAFDDVLFVADQTTQSLFTFNVSSGQFLRRIASSEDILAGLGELEHLIFSNC